MHNRRLRVNADDFGLTAGVTDGIIQAHKHGIVTHTSIMAVGLDFERAMALARKIPELCIGVHLCLTWGLPLMPVKKISTLIGTRGRFSTLSNTLYRTSIGRLSKQEVTQEWRSQIDRVIKFGIHPTHLDSHHNVHLLPNCLPIAVQLANEFCIPWLRRPAEGLLAGFYFKGHMLKRLALRALCFRKWPLQTSDHFRGLSLYGRIDFLMSLKKIIITLPPGLTELMVHPGIPDPLLEKEDSYVQERYVEFEKLCDPGIKNIIKKSNIILDE